METKERMHDTLTLEAGMPVIDGKGLLLGPNSPFQNIPILGMLL